MRAMLAIAIKDLREVRTAIIVFAIIALLLCFGAVDMAEAQRKETAPLEGARTLLVMMLALASFVISNGVVARELTSHTQIFLESLPVSRLSIFVGKLVVVVIGVGIVSAAGYAGTLLALDHAPGALRTLVALRLAGFSAAMLGLSFLLGFLGRYRIPIALLTFLTAIVLAEAKDVEVFRFGPLALLDETFASDSHTVPRLALIESLGVLGFCVAMAAALVVVREGDVPARLAQKMSSREKTFVVLGFLVYATAWGALSDKDEKPPYVLNDAVATEGDGVSVFLKVDPENVDADRALAQWLHGELKVARQWLNGMPLPPFFLVSRADLPEGVFEEGQLANADGVLYRLRPTRDPRQRERLFELMLHHAIASATRRRAMLEDRHFLLDATGLVIARRDHMTAALERDDDLFLHALDAMPDGPSPDVVDRWETTSARAGFDAARAAAFIGVRALATACGEDGTRAFIAETVGFSVPGDVRALWRTPDVDDALKRHCNTSRSAWLALWKQEHDAAVARLATQRASRPPLVASLAFDALSSRTRRAIVTIDVALPPETRVIVEWAPVRLDISLPDDATTFQTDRMLSSWTTGASIDRTFSSGERFFYRARAPDMKPPLTGPWQLAEVP